MTISGTLAEMNPYNTVIQEMRDYYQSWNISPNNKGFDILNLPDELLSWLISILHNSPILAPNPDLPWNLLLSHLQNHRISGIVSYRLNQIEKSCHPPDTVKNLIASHSTSISWFRTIAQLSTINQIFHDADIPYVLLKGSAIGWQVYPHPSLRDGVDIDILIREENVNAASSLLCKSGYEIRFDSMGVSTHVYHHMVFFPGPGKGIKTVELHWRPLYLPKATGMVTVQDLINRRSFIQTEIGQIPVLSIPDSLMYAVTHMWIGHPDELRLIWLVDIDLISSYIAQNNIWNDVEQAAIRWHGVESLRRSLILASLWMGTKTDAFVAGWPESTPDEAELFTHIERKISGRSLNIHEQIREMPNFHEKIKAIFYGCSAASKLNAVHSNVSIGVKVKAWWRVYNSLNGEKDPSLLEQMRTGCSWCAIIIRILLGKNVH